ncbi:YbdD/YjiX family protein [Variovorax jilinensis]|uniref:YbdD/YjiX family protein n=1 Tax=Variovorax jilinensis TaxID=3053513 RepID=UPI0033655B4E
MKKPTAASLGETGRYLARSMAQSLRLMVGLPDYDTYLSHMARTHPDREPMSYEAFFKERLEARYGGGKGRCC